MFIAARTKISTYKQRARRNDRPLSEDENSDEHERANENAKYNADYHGHHQTCVRTNIHCWKTLLHTHTHTHTLRFQLISLFLHDHRGSGPTGLHKDCSTGKLLDIAAVIFSQTASVKPNYLLCMQHINQREQNL